MALSTSRNSACSDSTARDTSGWNASDAEACGRALLLPRGRAKGEEVRVVAAAVDIAAGDSNPHTDSDRPG
jgi:hypothetical protein